MRRTHHNSGAAGRVAVGLLCSAVVLSGVAACSGSGTADGAFGPAPATSTQPALSAADYQARLTALEQAVRPAVDQVLGAGSLADVEAARGALTTLLAAQYADLSQLRPPTEAADAHRDLLWALDIGQDLIEDTASAEQNECGVDPPLENQLYDAKHAIYLTLDSGSLQNARQGLAARNLRLDAILPEEPAAPAVQTRRADNGQIVVRAGKKGDGRLEINNDTPADYAVSVVTSGNPSDPQVMIYVRAKSEATVTQISGTYEVYLESGTDWDAERRGFTRHCLFEKFDESFDQTSDWEISLAGTPAGNASTSEVPAF